MTCYVLFKLTEVEGVTLPIVLHQEACFVQLTTPADIGPFTVGEEALIWLVCDVFLFHHGTQKEVGCW